MIFTSTDEILSDLVGAGMMPIITHPERNGRLQHRLDDIARWIELGCLVQVTFLLIPFFSALRKVR